VFYLDNVDVGAISVSQEMNPFVLAAFINNPACNFVFRRISKPFRGDYRSANKQFLEILPIASDFNDSQSTILDYSAHLQNLFTNRVKVLRNIQHRQSVLRTRTRSESWLFPDIPTVGDLEERAPKRFDRTKKDEWIKKERSQSIERRRTELGSHLRPGVEMDAELVDGELRFYIDGVRVIDRVFVNEEEGPFVAAQWKLVATTFSITPSTDGKKLSTALRKLAVNDNDAAARQIISLQRELEETERQIRENERDLNALLYELYELDDADIRWIEQST
jgi:hypothetical protein